MPSLQIILLVVCLVLMVVGITVATTSKRDAQMYAGWAVWGLGALPLVLMAAFPRL